MKEEVIAGRKGRWERAARSLLEDEVELPLRFGRPVTHVYNPLEYAGSAHRRYLRRFAEGRAERPTWLLGIRMTDRAFGIEVLEEFHRARERHVLADDALYLIGVAHLAENEPELAIASWQKVVDDYPKSEWADPAEYRIGLAFVAMSAGPEYDKARQSGVGKLNPEKCAANNVRIFKGA